MGCGSSVEARADGEEPRTASSTHQDSQEHPPELMKIDVTHDGDTQNFSGSFVNRPRRESLSAKRDSLCRDDQVPLKSPRKRRTSEVLVTSTTQNTLDDFDAASNGPKTPRDAAMGPRTPSSAGFAELEEFTAFGGSREYESGACIVEFVSLVPPRDALASAAPLRCDKCQSEIQVKEARFCYHCGNALTSATSCAPVSDGVVTIYHYNVRVFRDQGSLLGKGTSGCIYKAVDTMNGQPLAVKECDANLDDEDEVMAIRRELRHLSSLRHPHIVDYYGCRVEEGKVMILMERLECGTLEELEKKFPNGVPETMVQTFARQLLEGVAYIHGADVTHRDIKPANLLVSSTGAVKLSDFGSAILRSDTNMQAAGSPAYMPPEVLEVLQHKELALEYGKAHDVWSVGCTVHELLTGKTPWSDLGLNPFALVMKLSTLRFNISSALSPVAVSFLERCLDHNMKTRATAEELLTHPFVDHDM